MTLFYADENFPLQVVEALRALGHDVLTALDAGNANQSIPDEQVLAFATRHRRAVLTLNGASLSSFTRGNLIIRASLFAHKTRIPAGKPNAFIPRLPVQNRYKAA